MSEDQGRGRAGAGHEADPAWLRHDFGDDTRAGDAPTTGQPQRPGSAPDDGWLRHDPADPAEPANPADRTHRDERLRPGTSHDTAAGPNPHGGAADGAGEPAAYRHDGGTDGDPAGPGDGSRAATRAAERRDTGGVGSMVKAATKEFVIVIGMALVLSFVVKTWLLQAFYIPSGSMEDTLVLNDRVIVSKLTPGAFELKRGDIIVFSDPGNWVDPLPKAPHGEVVTTIRKGLMFVGLLPNDSEDHLIKRVIGLPGDHVVCCDEGERLTVNGVPLVEPYIKPGDAPSSMDFDVTVPKGSVWVMGDHRSDSSDSRYHDNGSGREGSVPESLIVGRAVALVWPLDHLKWLSNPKATFAKVPSPGGVEKKPATSTTTGGG
jgi:signal peptidase I